MMLLEVKNLSKSYVKSHKAVDNISFELGIGECVGIVGESGCGKSTLARSLLRIEDIDSGSIVYKGNHIEKLKGKGLNAYRKEVQAVFQNPTASLNPKIKVSESLIDPYKQFQDELDLKHFSYTNKRTFIHQLLDAVELPHSVVEAYPHELSGGQKQRITIARAISIEPKLIILDEPTASLDVLSQGAVLKLLSTIQHTLGTAYFFISHDLAAIHSISQKIMVMKKGQLIDSFPKEELFSASRNSYTKQLVSYFE